MEGRGGTGLRASRYWCPLPAEAASIPVQQPQAQVQRIITFSSSFLKSKQRPREGSTPLGPAKGTTFFTSHHD